MNSFIDEGRWDKVLSLLQKGEYVVVPGKVAREMQVPFVDAHALTHDLVESYGPERSKELFMWIPAGSEDMA